MGILIFLDRFHDIDLPVPVLNRALGYGDASPRGFEILGGRAQSIVASDGGARAFVAGLLERDGQPHVERPPAYTREGVSVAEAPSAWIFQANLARYASLRLLRS